MNLRARLINHHKRWNIEFDDKGQFAQLKNRVVSIVDRIVGQDFAANSSLDRDFVELLGDSVTIANSRTEPTALHTITKLITAPQTQEVKTRGFGVTYLHRALKNCDDLKRLVTILQVLFWLLERHGYSQKIRDLADRLRLNVKLTPSVEFQIVRNKEKVILYPPGAQLLDEATVNEPLMWLENYPTAAEPFERALKLYLEGDSSGNRNLLDNLRFAIEQLLREVLENTKSLEQQKRPLLTWLGSEHRVHQQVVNMYEKLLFGDYTRYQNDAVKHSEGCSEEEIEFMIYLTGTFMRLIIKLSESNRVVVSS